MITINVCPSHESLNSDHHTISLKTIPQNNWIYRKLEGDIRGTIPISRRMWNQALVRFNARVFRCKSRRTSSNIIRHLITWTTIKSWRYWKRNRLNQRVVAFISIQPNKSKLKKGLSGSYNKRAKRPASPVNYARNIERRSCLRNLVD